MKTGLTIFEGVELEILTKEDVNIEFNGECLFNGKQICSILEYKNDRDAIGTKVRDNQKIKVKNSDVVNHDFRKLNNAGETFLTENGVMRLILNSSMPKANDFEDKVWEIVKEVQTTGKYDSVEQQIKKIEDETERNLTLTIYQLENIVKLNPTDVTTSIMLNNKKLELTQYKQSKELAILKGQVETIDKKIEKATVLREGDMSAEIIAKKFNIFSTSGKPHIKFAESLAKVLGFYLHPEGHSGYQDDYISINLTTRGGTTIPTIKYSKLALEKMREYIDENGLHIQVPPVLYKKNCKSGKVGDFNHSRIIFDEIEESIKINKITYDLYTMIDEYED